MTNFSNRYNPHLLMEPKMIGDKMLRIYILLVLAFCVKGFSLAQNTKTFTYDSKLNYGMQEWMLKSITLKTFSTNIVWFVKCHDSSYVMIPSSAYIEDVDSKQRIPLVKTPKKFPAQPSSRFVRYELNFEALPEYTKNINIVTPYFTFYNLSLVSSNSNPPVYAINPQKESIPRQPAASHNEITGIQDGAEVGEKVRINKTIPLESANDNLTPTLNDNTIPSTPVKLQENLYAIIIANEQYKRIPSVPYALNDGNAVDLAMKQIIGIPPENIDYLQNASLNDIKFALNKFRLKSQIANQKPTLIVYYAGHGVPEEETGEAYILPSDGIVSDLESGIRLKDLYLTT